MKGILEFNLPEDDQEFKLAQQGQALYGAVREFGEWLRSRYKHESAKSQAVALEHEETKNAFYDIFESFDL